MGFGGGVSGWRAVGCLQKEKGGEVRSSTAARPVGLATLEDPSARGADGGPGFTHQFSRGRLVGLRGHNSTPMDSMSSRCLQGLEITARPSWSLQDRRGPGSSIMVAAYPSGSGVAAVPSVSKVRGSRAAPGMNFKGNKAEVSDAPL